MLEFNIFNSAQIFDQIFAFICVYLLTSLNAKIRLYGFIVGTVGFIPGVYLLIVTETPISEIKFKLPDLVSRSKNSLLAKIDPPDDELIFALILKNFSDRQITLDKKLIDYIVKRIDRSYSKIKEFIYKVDEMSLKQKKPINLKTIKELL